MPEPIAAEVLKQDGPVTEAQIPVEVPEPATEAVGEEAEPQTEPIEGDEKPDGQKRLGGWQRKIVKLEREVEHWREAALSGHQAKSADESKTTPPDEEPKPPNFATYSGTVEDFQKELDAYPAKHRAYLEVQSQKQQQAQQTEKAVESFNERLNSLPEFAQIRKTAENLPADLLQYMEVVAAQLPNGPETVKELLLDKEFRDQLVALDKTKNGTAIAMQIHAISAGLLIAKRKSAATVEVATTSAFKPPVPVGKPSGARVGDIHDPSLPYKEFVKLREAQLAKG